MRNHQRLRCCDLGTQIASFGGNPSFVFPLSSLLDHDLVMFTVQLYTVVCLLQTIGLDNDMNRLYRSAQVLLGCNLLQKFATQKAATQKVATQKVATQKVATRKAARLQPERLQPKRLQPKRLQAERLQPKRLQPERLQPNSKGCNPRPEGRNAGREPEGRNAGQNLAQGSSGLSLSFH